MADKQKLDNWRAALVSRFPIIGAMRRRRAVTEMLAAKEDPTVVPILAEVAGLSDRSLAQQATDALAGLKVPAAIDALCAVALRQPAGPLAKLCKESNYRPSAAEPDSLFLIATRQLDLYLSESEYGKDAFRTLRAAYDGTDDTVRSLVMEVLRSGDRRFEEFFGKAKPLPECTEDEIKLILEGWVRHRSWPQLFDACLEIPLKYSFPLLDRFRGSGWEPNPPEHKSLYKRILADSQGQAIAPPAPPPAESSLFEKWLAEGQQGELAQLSETQLMERLQSATPPQGVSIVAAIAHLPGQRSSGTISTIAGHEHWLVRLAGLATGLTKKTDITQDVSTDSNYWIGELSGAAGVLEFWPCKATPKDVQTLAKAPPEAFVGKLGAVRKVLRTILNSQTQAIVVTEDKRAVREDDVEVVDIE